MVAIDAIRTYPFFAIESGEVMSGHEHTKRCYWDYLEARWVCRPELDEPALVTEFAAAVLATNEPVGASIDGN